MPESKEKKSTENVVELLPSPIKSWVGLLPPLMELTRRIAVPAQIILALLGLATSIYFGYKWNERSALLGDRIQSTLNADLNNTVWQHKGLAAYLLSDIAPKTDDEVKLPIDKIDKVIKEQEIPAGSEPKPDYKSEVDIALKATGTEKGDRIEQALYAGDESYYLFLPSTSLNHQNKKHDLYNEDDLNYILQNNPEINQDIDLIKRLIPVFKELQNVKINKDSVVQIYFITESGLLLIRSPEISNQLQFYKEQFPTHHNFTDRAYILGAREKAKENNFSPANVYQSEPYIDLGGHGLIKTYSKAYKLANGRYGILCLDVTKKNLIKDIESRLEILRTNGATYEKKRINIADSYKEVPEDFEWFKEKLNRNKESAAASLGRIASDEETSRDGILRFTIPLSASLNEKNGRQVELMFIRIDFNQFWENQNWYLIYAGIGFMVFLAFIGNIFQDYILLRKEISELVYKIDRVMTEAESPYVRLNSENEFEVVNDSFVKLLGYQNEPDLKETGSGTRRTFESILTPDSIRTYSEILKQSIQETFTDKYSIDMFKKNGEKIRAVVHGERIVFPTFRRKKYPPRFGIVIDYQNIDDQNKDTKKSGEESAENKN